MSKNQPCIDLVIPGLLNLPIDEFDPLELTNATPALHRLLRYANRQPNRLTDVDSFLLHRLGLTQSALPYAHAIDPQENEKLLCKPVHLKMDVNNAVVYPVNASTEDLNQLINDLADFFKQDCDIKSLPDNSWMMTLHHCRPIRQVPHYLSALGKKVNHYTEQAESNMDWFKLFNEMQMFLHQHEVNQRRQQSGQLPVNSLWCWGADDYRGEKSANTRWYSDDHSMSQLGRLYTGDSQPLAQFGQNEESASAVIVDLALLKALKGQTHADLLQILTTLEQQCFEPLLKRKNSRINLYTGGVDNFLYRPEYRFRLWKKPLSIGEIMVQEIARY